MLPSTIRNASCSLRTSISSRLPTAAVNGIVIICLLEAFRLEGRHMTFWPERGDTLSPRLCVGVGHTCWDLDVVVLLQ